MEQPQERTLSSVEVWLGKDWGGGMIGGGEVWGGGMIRGQQWGGGMIRIQQWGGGMIRGRTGEEM